jgi:hypothetical protein
MTRTVYHSTAQPAPPSADERDMPKIIELPRRGAVPYFQLQFALSEIADLAGRYSDDDSQVILTGAAARQRGFYTREEFPVVCAWKTNRTKTLVALNSAGDVQHATRAALRDGVSEARRIQALRALWGVDVRTASVFLHLADIDRWPILDVLDMRRYPTRFPRAKMTAPGRGIGRPDTQEAAGPAARPAPRSRRRARPLGRRSRHHADSSLSSTAIAGVAARRLSLMPQSIS